MIGRLIYKFILATSLLLALVLLTLWSRTRHTDLVASSATGGTYRELRIGKGELGVMLVTTWPNDQPARWGRPPATTQPGELGARITVGTGRGMLTLSNAAQKSYTLLDGSTLSPNPGPASWPLIKSTGSVTASESLTAQGKSPKILTRPTSMTIVGGSNSSMTIARPVTGGITRLAPTTTATSQPTVIVIPAASPTATASPTTIPTGAGTINFSVASVQTTAALPGSTGTLTITGGTLFIYLTYPYERYALPIWAIAAIILLPVWWSLLVMALRWRRRRSRRKRGLCERCGYDLRGNPGGNTCPECGAPTTGVPAPPTGEQLIARLK